MSLVKRDRERRDEDRCCLSKVREREGGVNYIYRDWLIRDRKRFLINMGRITMAYNCYILKKDIYVDEL